MIISIIVLDTPVSTRHREDPKRGLVKGGY